MVKKNDCGICASEDPRTGIAPFRRLTAMEKYWEENYDEIKRIHDNTQCTKGSEPVNRPDLFAIFFAGAYWQKNKQPLFRKILTFIFKQIHRLDQIWLKTI